VNDLSALLKQGVSEEDIYVMTHHVPERVLGIREKA